jgi:cytochrome c oxidase subunit 3/cytochrome o ubiquinol oxidase subunit 3
VSEVRADAAIAADWTLPDRGRVGIAALILAESAMFAIFVVAYVFYLGKSLTGPSRSVLDMPLLASLALWSSSVTIHLAVRALRDARVGRFTALWGSTVLLGALFLAATGAEWHRLIYGHGLTIRSNLFGTTFYSLVGLHAFHVIVGLLLLTTVLVLALGGHVRASHAGRAETLSIYWHFVDAVWVVVFVTVYVVGR